MRALLCTIIQAPCLCWQKHNFVNITELKVNGCSTLDPHWGRRRALQAIVPRSPLPHKHGIDALEQLQTHKQSPLHPSLAIPWQHSVLDSFVELWRHYVQGWTRGRRRS